ncbi:type I polyketide synthase [Amycolatopsis speibonae]|uniref:Thioester reductase domain-containing protein n=1 Tax=Amycolatopsis speibonae TaxID=1450224 RepID=A0ABV7PAI5_9PSEU
MLAAAASDEAGSVAFVDGKETWTWNRWQESTQALARGLQERGVGHGDVVVAQLPNSWAFLVVHAAVATAGGVLLPINPREPGQNVAALAQRVGARTVITVAQRAGKPHGEKVPIVGATVSDPDGVVILAEDRPVAISELIEEFADARPRPVRVRPDDPFLLTPSSGTTSRRPKICVHSHDGLLSNAAAVVTASGHSGADRLVSAAPVTHLFGLLSIHMALFSRASQLMLDGWRPEKLIDVMRSSASEQVTLFAVPTQLHDLLDHLRQNPGEHSVRFREVRTAGSVASPRLVADLRDSLAESVVVQWGMSELGAGLFTSANDPDDVAARGIGRPVSGAGVRIVDENGADCTPGTVGELWFTGPHHFRGYLGDPDLTGLSFQDGWLRTGDLASLDEAGLVAFHGRAAEMIDVGGKKFPATEVEELLADLPGIGPAAIVGRADERLGEYPSLLVTESSSATLPDVTKHLTTKGAAPHKFPAELLVVPGIPRTATGKIIRHKLAELADRAERIHRREEPDAASGPGAEELLRVVIAHARSVLADDSGPAGRDEFSSKSAFRDMGIDSLGAMRLAKALSAATGTALSSADVFNHATPMALAAYLAGRSSRTDRATPAPAPTRPRSAADDDPVVIVGMACRLPGAIGTPEDFWRLLIEEREVVGPPPSDRGWSLADLPADEIPGIPPDLVGGFLDDVAGFDAELFGITPVEARAMDPQHRLLLELAWEALNRAGLDPLALQGPETGVFVGMMSSDYLPRVSESMDRYHGYAMTGNAGGVASGRISYHLGLRGPSFTVDTACSSSLVALHQARRALRDGECDRAIVAGVTVMSTPAAFIDFGKQGLLAPDGRCKAFAAGADGVAWSEGAGVVVLERLSAARHRGHPVVAAISGSAINSDGASNGLTAPNGIAQQEVIQRALADARLTAADVQAVEAHGTGTQLGDLIEGKALQAAYGSDRTAGLWVGSAKSNLGHTQAAAGIVGLIKMALSIQHGTLPRTLHADIPLDQVDWSPDGLRLLTKATAWTGDSPRRGGVSAFGIGGTNAHVILEQPPGEVAGEKPPAPADPAPWVFSAASADGMRATAARLRDLADDLAAGAPAEIQGHLDDVARTLARTRSSLPHRAIALPDDTGDHRPALAALAAGDYSDDAVEGRGRGNELTAFVFSGQGQQWWGMARELARTAPPFATALTECDQALLPHLGWSVADFLCTEDTESAQPVDVVQPALFAMMVGLAALWHAHGVRPDAVTGHSQGEIVAAYVAGALSLADAVRIVAVRGLLLREHAGDSGMALIGRPVGEVREILESLGNPVSIGTVNGPSATGISGEITALEATMAWFRERGIPVHRIAIDYASHSSLMDPLLGDLRAELADIKPRRGSIPFFSATTGGQVDGLDLTAGYWCRNLRETVDLRQAVATMAERSYRRFVEVSAHPVLSDSIEETLAETGTNGTVIATVRRDAADLRSFRRSLGQAYVNRVSIDWDTLPGSTGGRFAELPGYPFQHQRFWYDAPTLARPAGDRSAAMAEPAATEPAERKVEQGFDSLLALVREQAAEVAGYPGADSVSGDSDFDELGFTSLSYTELQSRIVKRTGLRLPTIVIREHPTPEALSRFLTARTDLSGSAGSSSSAKRPTFAAVHGPDATTVRATELTLDKFLDAATLAGAVTLPRATGAPTTVLLTGANGYLGRFLCLEWLQRLSRTGGRLICLVRGETAQAATARLTDSFAGDGELSARFEELAADHLEVVRGDVAEANLGLDTATWRRLSETVDLIVHTAAQVNHVLPYDELFGANVVGTTELIRMALTTRIKPVNYISTVAVVATQKSCPDEDSDLRVSNPVRELDHGYANGYATSKWAGEVVLREAHDLCGLPVAVFRPGMILAHSWYAGQLNVSDVFTRLLLSLIVAGLAPKSFYLTDSRGDRRPAHYDGLPADFTAEAITELGARAGEGYRTFNVINPHDDAISLDTFVDWLIEAGHPLDRVEDHAEWCTRFEAAVRNLPEPLRQSSILPLLHAFAAPLDPASGAQVSADGFRTTVRAADSGLGRDIPHVSSALIAKYVQDLDRLGLTANSAELPPEPNSGVTDSTDLAEGRLVLARRAESGRQLPGMVR